MANSAFVAIRYSGVRKAEGPQRDSSSYPAVASHLPGVKVI